MVALATLVQRHQNRVRTLAFRLMGKWDIADDIAQEAFLRLYHSASRYQPTAALTTWLHRIVVNLCLDWSKQRKPSPWPDTDSMAADAPSGDGNMLRNEKLVAIRQAVAELPERQRIALVLHRFENLNHAAISAVTGWSEPAVESLLVRAYARLRERLKTWMEP